MLRLRELQLSFVEAVLAGNDVAIASQLKVRGGTPESRLKVYRNNTFSNLRAALADVYPVILRLVGEDFFKHAATHFIRAHPSTSGDLNDYGGGFGEFLAAFPPAAELPYLCDVARLEWAREKAYYAPDHAPFDLARLTTVPGERYGDMHFRLHPAASLLASPYPLLAIWETNQPDYTGDGYVDLGAGGVQLLITRRRLAVVHELLGPAEAAFLSSVAAGQALEAALGSAVEQGADFDLQASLARRVSLGDFIDFTL